jgi:hypothetical protein
MRGYMFRNRWFALLFVCLTLAGVTKLVGTDKEQGTLQQAAGQVVAQKAQAERLTTSTQDIPAEDGSAEEIPLASDEELIDEALGEDPTPPEALVAAANSSEPEEPADEIMLISRELPGQSPPAPPASAPRQ